MRAPWNACCLRYRNKEFPLAYVPSELNPAPPSCSGDSGLERERMVRVRVNQHFFRAAILSAYDYKWCVTGLAVPELLVASHIVPWARDTKQRMNPRKGLYLNALHDRAFIVA
jgi:predicted restriction endonuclease